MAPAAASTEVLKKPSYQLDVAQAQNASQALLKHMKQTNNSADKSKLSQNLLSSPEEEFANATIWLVLTTKKHIVDQKKLKPSKILVPHSLYSPESSICLIVADPQRDFKDAIESAAFPADLRTRITRIISLSKLKERYKSYESKRMLFSEHDVFLADDRIVALLPEALGKVFYKTGLKRPIPVEIDGSAPSQAVVDAKRAVAKQNKKIIAKAGPAAPAKIGAEINRALSSASVHLSPSTCTSVRVGLAGWKPDDVAENIQAVVSGLVERFVPKRWPGVRGIHIKGPDTASLPIYLAQELWEDEQDVLELRKESQKSIDGAGKKRKSKIEEYAAELFDEPLRSRKKKLKADSKPSSLEDAKAAETEMVEGKAEEVDAAVVKKLETSSLKEPKPKASKGASKEKVKERSKKAS